jgi:hypothetical protein
MSAVFPAARPSGTRVGNAAPFSGAGVRVDAFARSTQPGTAIRGRHRREAGPIPCPCFVEHALRYTLRHHPGGRGAGRTGKAPEGAAARAGRSTSTCPAAATASPSAASGPKPKPSKRLERATATMGIMTFT